MATRVRLTQALIAELCKAIGADGLPNKDACAVCGISEAVFYKWKQVATKIIEEAEEAGTKPVGLHVELVESLKVAEAEFKKTHLGVIRRAATQPSVKTVEHIRVVPTGKVDKDGNPIERETKEVRRETMPPTWQPSAWLLERKFTKEFGRQIIEHDGSVDMPAGGRFEIVMVPTNQPKEVPDEQETQPATDADQLDDAGDGVPGSEEPAPD